VINAYNTEILIGENTSLIAKEFLGIISEFARVEKIQVTQFRAIPTRDELLQLAEHWRHLREMTITGEILRKDESLMMMASYATFLESVSFPTACNVSDIGLAYLKRGCPLLKQIVIPNANISDAGLNELGSACKSLMRLSIGGQGITDAGLQQILQCIHLVDLSLHGCSITDNGMRMLAAVSHSWSSLQFISCKLLTDASMHALSTVVCNQVILSDLQLTNDGLLALSGSCMCRLKLHQLPSLTDDALLIFVRTIQSLRFLEVSECTALSDAAIAYAKGYLEGSHLMQI